MPLSLSLFGNYSSFETLTQSIFRLVMVISLYSLDFQEHSLLLSYPRAILEVQSIKEYLNTMGGADIVHLFNIYEQLPCARHSSTVLLRLKIVNRPCFQMVHNKAGMTFNQIDNIMSRLSARIRVRIRRGTQRKNKFIMKYFWRTGHLIHFLKKNNFNMFKNENSRQRQQHA